MMIYTIDAISYAFAAGAFLLLTLVLTISWRGRQHGAMLILATFFTALWGAIHAVQSELGIFPLSVIAVVELLRSALWILFLITLLPDSAQKQASNKQQVVWIFALLFGGLLLNAFWSMFFQPIGVIGHSNTQIIGQLLFSVFGFWLVEQVYRNLIMRYRWAVKYLCLALAGLFFYDFFLYSEYALFHQFNHNLWVARGFISAFIVPFIAVSAARNPDWSLEVFVSRQVVFHTATLLGAGVYLLLMATAGYYLRHFGGTWGVVFQTTFFFAGVFMLVALFSSKTFRGKMKVYLSKHFFSYRYDYREEWIRIIHTLSADTSEQSLNERVIAAVGGIVDSQGGVLFLGVDGDYFQQVSIHNMQADEVKVAVNSPFIAFLQKTKWVVDVTELETNRVAYQGLATPDWLRAISKAWLVAPLFFDAKIIGFLVLKHSRSINQLHWEERDLLKTASYQAAGYLVQKESADALTQAKQFEGFNRLSAFVMHDLKNLIAQLSLVVKNAQKHKENPDFVDDAINTVDNSVQKMSNLMAHMRSGMQQTEVKTIDVNVLITNVVQKRAVQNPAPTFQPAPEPCYIRSPGARFESVLGHLIQNAQEATSKQGKVAIFVEKTERNIEIRVVDDGCGMSADFIQTRLFKPFDTTKGLTGMGIGAYESKTLIESMGGELKVDSQFGSGSTFVLCLPVTNAASRVQGNGQ